MLSFVLRLWASFWLTLGGRLRGRPLRAGWSFAFEVIARTLKSNAARVSRLDWAAQRKAWEAMVQPSPILAKLRFERATVGGVPGEWFIPVDAPEGGPVLLYLHGGSFIYGSIASTHRELIAREAVASGARTFAADYRLAPEHPFPAAIDDAVAAYRGLLASGVAASRIVVGGESAGGNLTLVTILRARAEGVPLPAGAVLACPWVDLTARGGSVVDNAPFDWAEPRDFERWAETYLAGHDPRDPMASPLFADLGGLPPLLVQVGSAEMLRDQVAALVDRAKSQGANVESRVHPDMVHNWHMLASIFRSGQDAIDEIGAFVRRVTMAKTAAR
jgi:epsilon-lactone hydrolase